ncbi:MULTISPECIES: hypothetical protein [Nostocales]|uniref:Uncharacterized protein n=1 Tax=Tolypothrix bouteillei VB521301 TaxID=1479485 RepID=A0A0C1QWV4_9CYAN
MKANQQLTLQELIWIETDKRLHNYELRCGNTTIAKLNWEQGNIERPALGTVNGVRWKFIHHMDGWKFWRQRVQIFVDNSETLVTSFPWNPDSSCQITLPDGKTFIWDYVGNTPYVRQNFSILYWRDWVWLNPKSTPIPIYTGWGFLDENKIPLVYFQILKLPGWFQYQPIVTIASTAKDGPQLWLLVLLAKYLITTINSDLELSKS